MTSVGSILRAQRETQGRAIAEIAEELCITQRYLRAIEENDTASIPGLFFFKNFARQYAAILGIDEKVIRPALDAIKEPEDTLPRHEIRVPDRLVQESNRRHLPDVSLGWSVMGLVVVLLSCSGFYAWWKRAPQRSAAPAAIAQTAPVMAVATATPAVQLGGAREGQLEVRSEVVPGEASGVVLTLSATERTWLSVSSGGREIFAGVLQPHESKTLAGLDGATMKVGNAGGIEVHWNGKPIGPLGTRGQVLTIRFTPEDFEIVPPKQQL